MKKNNGSAANYLRSVLISICTCAAGVLIIMEMMYRGKIEEGSAKVAIPILLAVSVLAGGIFNRRMSKKGRVLSSVFNSVIFLILLLIGGMIIDGPFEMIGRNAVAIGVGLAISCVICLKRTGNTGGIKKRYR